MTLIAYLFMRLQPAKNVVRYMCKKFPSRIPLQKEHARPVSALFESARQHLYNINWSMGRQLNCKKFLLVICKIWRLFVNILSGVEKYSLPNNEYLKQPIQVKLSQKQKTFSGFLSAFLESKLNFEHSQKKDDPHSLFISDSTACEKRG